MTASRRLLFDTDLFVLLAGAGLLDELIHAIGFEVDEARRLQPLPFMLKQGSLVRRYPSGILQQAAAWCERIPAVRRMPDPDLLGQLTAVQDMDPGEALLLARAAELDGALVASGDKRACLGLIRAVDRRIATRLQGKWICLEAALVALLNHLDFALLASRLTSVRAHHQTLRVLLSQGNATDKDSFRAGLHAYWRDLSDRTGELLWTPT